MKNYFLFAIVILLFVSSCNKDETQIVKGMKPLYISNSVADQIQSEVAKPFTTVGKLFVKGNKIYISDVGSGVHIIDNTFPATPSKEAFISIYGNNDMAVKDNIMFADNGNNLLAIDITDISNAQLTKKIENVYESSGQFFPIGHIGDFECVEVEKGFVYDWVLTDLIDPKCRR